MTRTTQTEAARAADQLRELFPQGSTVTTLVRHVSRSGMMRAISVLAVTGDREIEDVSWMLGRLGLFTFNHRHGGVTVNGCGMDMTFHVVYSLAVALYGDGYALTHGRVI